MAKRPNKYASGEFGIPSESDVGNSIDNPELPGNGGENPVAPVSAAESAIDPNSASEPTGEPTRTRTRSNGNRARKSDTGNNGSGKRKGESKAAAADLSLLIASAHWMLAKLTNVEEMNITEEEAIKMGEAVQRVNDLFDGSVLSPKAAALGNLAFVFGSVYLPKALTLKQKISERKKSKPVVISIADAGKAPN